MTRKQAKKVLERLASGAELGFLTSAFFAATAHKTLFGDLWRIDQAETKELWGRCNNLSEDYFGPRPTLAKAEALRQFIESLPE